MSISSLIDMPYEGHENEAVPPVSLLDELMHAAYDCLQQFRARGMPDTVERSVLDKAFTESTQSNSPRLRALISRFEKAIQAHDARLLHASHDTAALAAFSGSSIPVYSTSDTLARHEDAEALPPYGTALGAPASLHVSHDHAAPPAAPAGDGSFHHDPHAHKSHKTHNAPVSLNQHEHTAALPRYDGTAPRVSTHKRGRPSRKALPPQEQVLAALSSGSPPVARAQNLSEKDIA
jgi:hypothetical protein